MNHRHWTLPWAAALAIAILLGVTLDSPSAIGQATADSSQESKEQEADSEETDSPPAAEPETQAAETPQDEPDKTPSEETPGLDPATVDQAIGDLANDTFRKRHKAFLVLVRGGSSSIPALEQGAKAEELEIGMRCVEAMVQIARDEENLSSVVEALDRLASDPSYQLAGLAERYARTLKMTDEERAIAALTAAGARMHRSRDGSVFSVSITRDRQLTWLRFLPTLRSVNMSGNGVTDAGLEHLADLESLTSVSISQSAITDAGLGKLDSLSSLVSLSLNGSQFSGHGLRKLARLPRLVSLSLHSSSDDSDLQGLAEVRQIKQLSLNDLKLSPQSVGLLNQLDHLTSCTLSIRDVDEEDLQAIAEVQLPMLLNIQGSGEIPDASWKHLSGSSITGLIVSNISITDRGLAHMARIKKLERLQLFATSLPITEDGLKHLHQMKSLQILYLRGVDISDEAIARLKKELPNLRATWIRK